jgi:hypothetical protein
MAFEDFWMSQTEEPAGASLRFSGAQYLQRLIGTSAPTNGNKATLSMWVKRGALSVNNTLITAGSTASSTYNGITYQSSTDNFRWVNQGGGSQFDALTNALYRDPGAWYHLVFVIDGNNAVASNRDIVYVNGVAQSLSAGPSGYGVNPAQSASNGVWWTTPSGTAADNKLTLGAFDSGTGLLAGYYLDGYISDVFLVDGQALPATTFGYFDANGVWVTKTFSAAKAAVVAAGGFGANGFALEFKSANFNTGTLVWADQSGNGNDFTANWNCAAGSKTLNTTDIVSDGPQVNASQFNMLTPGALAPFTFTYTNTLWSKGASWNYSRYGGVKLPDSGKWYFEWNCINPNSTPGETVYGFAGRSFDSTSTTPIYIGGNNDSVGWYANGAGGTAKWLYNNVATTTGPSQTGAGSEQFRIGIAVDCDQATPTARLFIKTNNISWSEQTSQTIPRSLVTSGLWPASSLYDGNQGLTWGAVTPDNPFPAANGYNQLYANLIPATSIPDGSTGFQAVLDTGANILTAAQAAFPNGLWWVKDRVNANQHQLVDSINTSASTLSSPSATTGAYAAPTGNSVAWAWATPASGINAATGFSITTGTHGLGQSPQFVIDRQLNVYHASLGSAAGLKLSTTAASAAQAWTVNTTTVSGPAGAGTYYSWAPITGYSSFGSYAGNGSADGPFAYCGFLPAFVLIKCSSTTGNWEIYDNARNTYNPETLALQPNLTNAESTIDGVDFLSNGFKIRTTDANFNTSGQTYIYAAFAENPFGGSNVAPVTAR